MKSGVGQAVTGPGQLGSESASVLVPATMTGLKDLDAVSDAPLDGAVVADLEVQEF